MRLYSYWTICQNCGHQIHFKNRENRVPEITDCNCPQCRKTTKTDFFTKFKDGEHGIIKGEKPKFEIKKPGEGEDYSLVETNGEIVKLTNTKTKYDKNVLFTGNYETGPDREARTKTRARRERATRLLYKAAETINAALGDFRTGTGSQLRMNSESKIILTGLVNVLIAINPVFHPDTKIEYIIEIFKNENVDIDDLWLR
jgi:hypothetical protein